MIRSFRAVVVLVFAAAVTASVALRGQRSGRRVALALLLLAWALPSVVTAKMFEWLYHPAGGLVNFLLGGRTINWLGDPGLALPALIVADVWRSTPFVALLCYARLLTIPPDLYEAAQADGASGAQAFARITWPLVRPILLVTLLFRTLDALRAFVDVAAYRDHEEVAQRMPVGLDVVQVLARVHVAEDHEARHAGQPRHPVHVASAAHAHA